MAKVGILLPSFEKPGYILDAIKSIQAQTFTDWELHIVENSRSSEVYDLVSKEIDDFRVILERRDMEPFREINEYPTAVIINEYYNREGLPDYLFYISDDDTLEPECLAELVTVLDKGLEVAYCAVKCWTEQLDGKFASTDNGVNTLRGIVVRGSSVDCMYDGGQVLFRRQCLRKLPQPFYQISMSAGIDHCDGQFLQKLVNQYPWCPVGVEKPLVNHRRTHLSTWVKNV